MAVVSAAVVTAGAAAASAASSHQAGKEQDKQNRLANARIQDAATQSFQFGQNGGADPFGSFNSETGEITTNLGDRLQGQRDFTDSLAATFGGRIGQDHTQGLRDTIGLQGQVAGMQADPNAQFFSQMGSRAQGGLDLAQAGLGRASGIQGQLDPFAQQAFGMAQQQFGDIGTAEQVQQDTLGLLRQQAAPFEDRAFTGMLDNQFATGRLGSSGGALQTEAFARGLAQADTSRQLQSFQEGRNVQNNAMSLAQGFSGIGGGALTLGDQMMGNAFNNFQGMSGLANDIEGQRFGQSSYAQQNLFNQLGSIFTNQGAEMAQGQSMEQQNFSNFLRSLGAGQAIDQIPLDRLGFAQGIEAQRSNAALGVGQSMNNVNMGQGASTNAAAWSGLAGAAQNFGDMFQGIGTPATTSMPSAITTNATTGQITGPNGLNVNASAFGTNPFAGMFGD